MNHLDQRSGPTAIGWRVGYPPKQRGHCLLTTPELGAIMVDGMIESDLRQTIDHMAHWGFDLVDPVHPHCPGYRQLLVAMRPIPTHAHFDPEQLSLALLERNGVAHATLHRESSAEGPLQVCPGNATIADRVGKKLGFYLYGGTLEAVPVTQPQPYMLYRITSPAPILGRNGLMMHGQEDALADSSEALFARLRAQSDDDDELLQRLTLLGPLPLYGGCIESLWTMYRASPTLPTAFSQFFRLLQIERRWLSTQSGLPHQTLEQMLAHPTRPLV
jgi:hypothetical protein